MNKDFSFSWKFKNFKIQTVHERWDNENRCYDKTTPLRKNCPLELIKYFDDAHGSCYIVAWFELGEEGYELRSIGSRLFDDIDADEIGMIWVELQAAQKMLDTYFDACQKTKHDDCY